MIKLLQSPAGSMLVGGVAFLATVVLLLQKPLSSATKPPTEEPSGPVTFWQQHNPEVDQLIEQLQKEKAAVDKKEAALHELQMRLDTERAEINQVTQRVAQLQAEFDQNVVRLKEEELPNLKKLARMYSGMSPQGVSVILKELDDQTVVKILSLMKEDEAAPLLDAMAKDGDEQAKRAATISEMLRKSFSTKRKTP